MPSSEYGAVELVEKEGTDLPQQSVVWSPSAKGARGAMPKTSHLPREKSTSSRLDCTQSVIQQILIHQQMPHLCKTLPLQFRYHLSFLDLGLPLS